MRVNCRACARCLHSIDNAPCSFCGSDRAVKVATERPDAPWLGCAVLTEPFTVPEPNAEDEFHEDGSVRA